METPHIFKLNEFPDLLQEINISSDDIKRIIESYKLTFIQKRDNQVEWGMAFPMFVDAFYDYVIKKQSIPNQEQFYQHYLYVNKEFFEQKKLSEEIMYGLKARVFRTYPSLVRDLYFNKLVKENLPNVTSCYNKKLDIEQGIDLMISTNDKNYAINLFTDTERAYIGRNKKQNRHKNYENVEYIEFPVNFKGSLKCGDFFLYGNEEFINLKKIIKL
jgi:hypothetical protein